MIIRTISTISFRWEDHLSYLCHCDLQEHISKMHLHKLSPEEAALSRGNIVASQLRQTDHRDLIRP